MRLGAPVYNYQTAEEWALAHVAKGYGAAYWPLPVTASADEEDEFIEAAGKHQLVIAEVGIWNNLMDHDPIKRDANLRMAILRIKQADRVGARCCVNISGSRGPAWDGPHPDNMTEETFREVVRVTQQMLDEAEPTNTFYTLEAMPWMYPWDLQSTKQVIEAVDRESFAVHVDICNMINSPDKVYRSGEISEEYCRELAPYIRSIHVKDVELSMKMTTHISECMPGEGDFDHDALLIAASKLDDVPFMCEHLATEEEYDRAVAYLRKRADILGVKFTSAV